MAKSGGEQSALVRCGAFGLPNLALATNAQCESGRAESSKNRDGVLRLKKMLEGIGAGFVAIAGGVKRSPIPNNYSEIYHQLKKTGPVRMTQ